MSSAAQIAANRANAQAATGPRTPAGKFRSSRNAVTHGLYSYHDFIASEKKEEYTRLRANLRHALSPVGVAEHALVAEILHAIWRLRCCTEAKAELLANSANADPATHASIDHARTLAQGLFRRSVIELRRLQADRIAGRPSGSTPSRNERPSKPRRLLTFI